MSATASHGGAMGHYLRIHDDYDEIRLALVCTAAPGSPCRLRPADGREDWTYADADLIDSGVCWAVEWADEGGCVTSGAAEGVTWPMIPVTVEYPRLAIPKSRRERIIEEMAAGFLQVYATFVIPPPRGRQAITGALEEELEL